MIFKFRKKEYKVERDSHQFILSQKYITEKGEEEYNNIGYYHDLALMVKKLISLHVITSKDGKELVNCVALCCKQLGTAIERAVKQPSMRVGKEINKN